MDTAGRKRVLLSWSSGKDSAWTLQALRAREDVELVGLLTTLTTEHDRVSMHGVRTALCEAQAAAAELELWKVVIPSPCSNEDYEAAMARVLERARAAQVDAVAFGDLFLADVRAYRERQMADTGIETWFPLWGQDTTELARAMQAGGLEARLTCVDPRQLDRSFSGRPFDAAFLAELPAGVDPCGENGEFHTFVHAGPMFRAPVPITVGETVERGGFVFTDLAPA